MPDCAGLCYARCREQTREANKLSRRATRRTAGCEIERTSCENSPSVRSPSPHPAHQLSDRFARGMCTRVPAFCSTLCGGGGVVTGFRSVTVQASGLPRRLGLRRARSLSGGHGLCVLATSDDERGCKKAQVCRQACFPFRVTSLVSGRLESGVSTLPNVPSCDEHLGVTVHKLGVPAARSCSFLAPACPAVRSVVECNLAAWPGMRRDKRAPLRHAHMHRTGRRAHRYRRH